MVSPSGTVSFPGYADSRSRPDRPMTGERMRPRVSLLGKFSGMSLFAMVLLGLTIGYVLQDRIERRALDGAAQLTEVFNRVTVAPNVTRGDLARPLPPEELRVLDRALAGIGDGDR